jgi:hypothetical protein
MDRPDGANPGEDGPGHPATCLGFLLLPVGVAVSVVGVSGLVGDVSRRGLALLAVGLLVLAASVAMFVLARRRGERQE